MHKWASMVHILGFGALLSNQSLANAKSSDGKEGA